VKDHLARSILVALTRDAADSGSQLGLSTGVRGFVSHATHDCQPLVNGIGSQMARF
jgi:hypothetical protein